MGTLREKLDRLGEKIARMGELGGFLFVGVDAARGRDVWEWVYCDPAEVARRRRAGEPVTYRLTASGPAGRRYGPAPARRSRSARSGTGGPSVNIAPRFPRR